MADPSDQPDLEALRALADLLMGAAFADGVYVGAEALAVYKILRDRTGETELPDELYAHIEAFDPDAFDLDEAVTELSLTTPQQRRALLALVAEVTEADNVFDLDEDAYIRRLGQAIGADPEEYEDLTVDLLAVSTLTTPPPVPRT